MAIIVRNLGLLFIQAPRTGCTAIEQLLVDQFGGQFLPQDNILNEKGFVRVQRKHCTARQLVAEGLITADYDQRLTTVTTVRNPFDSLVSLYVKKRDRYEQELQDPDSWVHVVKGYVEDIDFCRTHTFEEWLNRHYSVGPVQRLLGNGRKSLYGRYTDGASVVMRFERLQEDFTSVMRSLGVRSDVTIPMVNPTPQRSRSYQAYYTPAARELVEYVFKPDLDRYGYAFDHEQQELRPLVVGAAR